MIPVTTKAEEKKEKLILVLWSENNSQKEMLENFSLVKWEEIPDVGKRM